MVVESWSIITIGSLASTRMDCQPVKESMSSAITLYLFQYQSQFSVISRISLNQEVLDAGVDNRNLIIVGGEFIAWTHWILYKEFGLRTYSLGAKADWKSCISILNLYREIKSTIEIQIWTLSWREIVRIMQPYGKRRGNEIIYDMLINNLPIKICFLVM